MGASESSEEETPVIRQLPTRRPGSDYCCRIILYGDSEVGKTSILRRWTEDTFLEEQVLTIGCDFRVKNATLGGFDGEFQIWDTAGSDKFRPIRLPHNEYQGIILVYDITNRASFTHLESWVDKELKDYRQTIPVVVVGNKVDVADKIEVPQAEGKEFATKRNWHFIETSAKENINVDETFSHLASVTVKHILDTHPAVPVTATS